MRPSGPGPTLDPEVTDNTSTRSKIACFMLGPSGGDAAAEETAGLRRILLVDDHQAKRYSLSLLIRSQSGWQVCAETGCAADGLPLVRKHRPDLAIVDLRLGDVCGLDLIRDLAARAPGTRLLVYSILNGPKTTRLCFEAGAHGFVSKQEPVGALTDAIRQLLKGGVRFPSFEAVSADFLELDIAWLA